MSELYEGFAQLGRQSIVEWLAVVLGVAYLVLVIRKNPWCWPCAFISTALFSWLFFDVKLPMEAMLHIYYMLMAVYGFYQWRKGTDSANRSERLYISTRAGLWHVSAISSILFLTLSSGYLLSETTDSVMPYLDSFTTWGAIITTYMVAKKIFENWFYWLVINSASIYLYIDRELYGAALLMTLYIVLIFVGIVSWKNDIRNTDDQYDVV